MNVRNDYYEWLLDYIRSDTVESYDYNLLLRELHRIPFKALVKGDLNRADDGLELRELYSVENNLSMSERYSLMRLGECSVLEMMIAFSERIYGEIMGGLLDKPKSYWFWIMVSNLGLDVYTDDVYYQGGKDAVENTIDVFLSRQYRRNGKGGLFPLENPKCDQRNVELWYQANYYMQEHYQSEINDYIYHKLNNYD